MVSALKVGGQRLHALAREGVVRSNAQPRGSRCTSCRSRRPDESRWGFDVTCSVGTYVRVLLSDLADDSVPWVT